MVELLFGLACLAFVIVGLAYLEARKQHFALQAKRADPPVPESQSGFDHASAVSAEASTGETTYDDPLKAAVMQGNASIKDRLQELMGVALTAPTPDAIIEFSAFASRLRTVGETGGKTLGPYNIMMVFTQRPGAHAVASRREWAKVGQTVRPDAIPILILRPNGPTMQVFELEDTLPQREKNPRLDPFAAAGEFKAEALHKMIEKLSEPSKRNLKVEVDFADLGSNSAGWICKQPGLRLLPEDSFQGEPDLKALHHTQQQGHWRVMLNRRLNPTEQFATLLHELGHLFCGHVGPFQQGNPLADEYGWPDRSRLPYEAMEVEAELVSWHICERKGLVTGSALYLRPYMEGAGNEMKAVDLDRVTRAIAKIEHYVPQCSPVLKATAA